MVEFQGVQAHGRAEQRDYFHLRLHPVDVEKRRLIGGFAAMNRKIARVDTKAKGDGMQFAQFDSSARYLLRRFNHAAANDALEGVGRDIPAQQTKTNQAENTESKKELEKNAAAHGRRWLAPGPRG